MEDIATKKKVVPANRPQNRSRAAAAAATAAVDAPASEPMVALVRKVARQLVATGGTEAFDLALTLVAKHAREATAANAALDDLRSWQLLASDLAAVLEPLDEARSRAALDLAGDLRATVTMIARNPAEQVALRPSSRRTLDALWELGGHAPAIAVRTRTGHSPSHFSNIVAVLTARGFVRSEQAVGDRRERQLSLTPLAREALSRRPSPRVIDETYRQSIQAHSGVPSEEYPVILKTERELTP